jgi:lipooligosaccharide transport system ATP-binding protein
LLDFAGLASKADARIATLSGGMKRRLTLARALVNDPDIVFLDEPTTGLDPQARHLIWDRLKQLKAAGKTLILTTHFMDEAERLCDTLIVIDHGRKITEGSPRRADRRAYRTAGHRGVSTKLRGQLAAFRGEAHRQPGRARRNQR